jgi:HSP20 family protein
VPDRAPSDFPQWNLVTGEVEETARDIVVRVDVPGMGKEDCRVTIEDDVLYLEGERHFEREQADSTWHLTERAYGTFRRAFPLPRGVVLDQATASYRNGTLTVRLPKAPGGGPTRVHVS